jgi:L-asparaginase
MNPSHALENAPNSILILVTGGTLDKEYDELTGALVFPETHLTQMLQQARCTLPIEVKVLMQKDSLEMTDDDRDKILHACKASSHLAIVITHGTDTMTQTACHLLANGDQLTGKRIVLTGAMRPYALGRSDALFNLGTALAFAQNPPQQLSSAGNIVENAKIPSPARVGIAMNGRYFPADRVEKDYKKGVFKAI